MLEWIKVAYKQLLLERIEFVAERAQTAHLNLKNHWIRKIPEHYFIPLVQGDGDYYGEIEMSNDHCSFQFHHNNHRLLAPVE